MEEKKRPMTAQEKAEAFAAKAPELTEQEKEAINDLFPHYIFRRRRTRDVWTTCCRVHMKLDINDPREAAILDADHQSEPRTGYDWPTVPIFSCPYCGKKVIIKELGRTGNRANLYHERRALVLRWYKGSLWGRGYECSKSYSSEIWLTKEPEMGLVAVYRWRPGDVLMTQRYVKSWPFTGFCTQTGPLKKGHWDIPRPFRQNWEEGTAYWLIGKEEIQKSPFRYCMAEEFDCDSMIHTFLTACAIYPRKIEMLMKAGMTDVVDDLVFKGTKHAYAIKWEQEEKNPFGLNKQQLKEFLATERRIGTLEIYKKLDGKVSMKRCEEIDKMAPNMKEMAGISKKWNIPMEKLIRYLERQIKSPAEARLRGTTMAGISGTYKDYLDAAEAIGRPLYRQDVLMPKTLREAHDKAAKEYRKLLQAERDKIEAEKLKKESEGYIEIKKKLEKKYAFEMDGIMIRVPENAQEIMDEGRILEHCVAGYARRHITGKCVILFMRRKKAPGTPWLTIEMNGNTLVQIHGFRNERVHTGKGQYAPDPRETQAEYLDTWIKWMKDGSKRNKDGSPIIPKKRKVKTA